MWKKSEEPPTAPPPAAGTPHRAAPSRDIATLGPSITIKGDLSGQEDLVIQGKVEGEVRLKKNRVTVGKSGQVRADIYGKSVQVEGEVRGNLYGETEVVIRASGRVEGNIVSPRVTLENGSNFKGSIDMEPTEPKKAGATPMARPGPAPAAGAAAAAASGKPSSRS